MAGLMSSGGAGPTIIDLGEIGTNGIVDVKSKLPNVYSKLKSENFFEVPTLLTLRAYSVGEMDLRQNSSLKRATYDSSTGKLSVYYWQAYADKPGIGNTSCQVGKRRIYCIY